MIPLVIKSMMQNSTRACLGRTGKPVTSPTSSSPSTTAAPAAHVIGKDMNTFCRINGSRRRDLTEDPCVQADGSTVSIETESGLKEFNSFDGVFHVTADQSQVYAAVNEVMDFTGVVRGKTVTVLAYGQTGGGKTHTIYGDIWKIEPLGGLLPRAVEAVFNEIHALSVEEQSQLAVHITFLSLYNEEISDLLDDSRRKGALTIRESQSRGVYIQNLHEEPVASVEDTIEQVRRGKQNMMVACTTMEISMSRMQTIFTLTVSRHTSADTASAEPLLTTAGGVEPSTTVSQGMRDLALGNALPTPPPAPPLSASQEAPPPPQPQPLQLLGKLVFVDLAGSERCVRSSATGTALRDDRYINRSLSALGSVLCCLGDGSRHVPYRDSKLTRLLQGALSEGAKTAFIGAVTCWARDAMETLSVLRFLQRVRLCHRHPASSISADGVSDTSAGESAKPVPAVTTGGTEK